MWGPSKQVALCDCTGHMPLRLPQQRAHDTWCLGPQSLPCSPRSEWSFPFCSISIALPCLGNVVGSQIHGLKHASWKSPKGIRTLCLCFATGPAPFKSLWLLSPNPSPHSATTSICPEILEVGYRWHLHFLFTVFVPLKLFLSLTAWCQWHYPRTLLPDLSNAIPGFLCLPSPFLLFFDFLCIFCLFLSVGQSLWIYLWCLVLVLIVSLHVLLNEFIHSDGYNDHPKMPILK